MNRAQTLLLFLAVSTSQGCVGIPLFEHPRTANGHEVRSLIGNAQSDRILRLGVSTRQQVTQELGNDPRFSTAGQLAWGYEYAVPATLYVGLGVVSHGFYMPPWRRPYTAAYYFLFLEFDHSGALTRFSLVRREGGVYASSCDLWDDSRIAMELRRGLIPIFVATIFDGPLLISRRFDPLAHGR